MSKYLFCAKILSSGSLIIILSVFSLNSAQGQYNPCPIYDEARKIPEMYNESGKTKPTEKKFNKKRRKLSKFLNRENKFIWYNIGSFNEMINYFEDTIGLNPKNANDSLYVLFASYNNSEGSKYVPEGQNNKLTLIFFVNKDRKNRYFIIANGFFTEISQQIANAWQDNYVNNRMKAILPTLNFDSENYYLNGSERLLSDTRSLRYQFGNWKDYFIEEVKYQNCKNKANINGIKAVFAAYTKNGNPSNNLDEKGKFKFRLHVIYELTASKKGKTVAYSIEDQKDYANRKAHYQSLTSGGGGNNGQLCPPANGCPN